MIHSQLPFIPDDPLQKFGISFPSLTLFMTKTLSIHYLAPKTLTHRKQFSIPIKKSILCAFFT